jgi:hypothetical protein
MCEGFFHCIGSYNLVGSSQFAVSQSFENQFKRIFNLFKTKGNLSFKGKWNEHIVYIKYNQSKIFAV